jgi:hypothetical protein
MCMIVFVSCVQKQLQEYDFQFSAWPTDFDVADVEGYVLFITRSVSDPDPDWIRIQSGLWIRIHNPDPYAGGQKLPTKI